MYLVPKEYEMNLLLIVIETIFLTFILIELSYDWVYLIQVYKNKDRLGITAPFSIRIFLVFNVVFSLLTLFLVSGLLINELLKMVIL